MRPLNCKYSDGAQVPQEPPTQEPPASCLACVVGPQTKRTLGTRVKSGQKYLSGAAGVGGWLLTTFIRIHLGDMNASESFLGARGGWRLQLELLQRWSIGDCHPVTLGNDRLQL